MPKCKKFDKKADASPVLFLPCRTNRRKVLMFIPRRTLTSSSIKKNFKRSLMQAIKKYFRNYFFIRKDRPNMPSSFACRKDIISVWIEWVILSCKKARTSLVQFLKNAKPAMLETRGFKIHRI